MSAFRSVSSSAEKPERVSSKNVGDFGTATWSFLAIFRIVSASSTKVGAVSFGSAIVFEGMGFSDEEWRCRETTEEENCKLLVGKTLDVSLLKTLFGIIRGEQPLLVKERSFSSI